MIKTLGAALAGLLVAAPVPAHAPFTLSSPTFANNALLGMVNEGNIRGCHGANVAPTLAWRNAPAGTRSYALYMYDRDAKLAHWFVYNIPATVHKVTDASAPMYTLGKTSFGNAKYDGPCPPRHAKAHHYYFTLIALREAHVKAPRGTAYTLPAFIKATPGQWITYISIVGTFQRPVRQRAR